MVAFVDAHREDYGVEPICRQLPIAPSVYDEHKRRQAEPERVAAQTRRDAEVASEIARVHEANFGVDGARKVWLQLKRERMDVARCTGERLMRAHGLEGGRRGRRRRTTIADAAAAIRPDLVKRQFTATRPDQLWVADFTYVATWTGFVYTAFVIDEFARRLVGWRVTQSMSTELVLEALEQAVWSWAPEGVIHHRDRGSQYVSIRYSERLEEAGITPSVGSVGDSYDTALAETIIGLYKAEVIERRGPWRSVEAVEYGTLEWVDWYNTRRLLEPIGDVPPAEKELAYDRQATESAPAA